MSLMTHGDGNSSYEADSPKALQPRALQHGLGVVEIGRGYLHKKDPRHGHEWHCDQSTINTNAAAAIIPDQRPQSTRLHHPNTATRSSKSLPPYQCRFLTTAQRQSPAAAPTLRYQYRHRSAAAFHGSLPRGTSPRTSARRHWPWLRRGPPRRRTPVCPWRSRRATAGCCCRTLP